MRCQWIAVFVAATLALGNTAWSDDSLGRPNIVLILCDDMGFSDLGCYGGEIETPNLDRLAAEGMRFRTFYNNAKCEHTRASLLTGHWWHHVGASPTVHYSQPTFGERMRDAGYRTLMVGKWHAGQKPFDRGFDRHYGLLDGCCNFWNPGEARPGEPTPARKKIRRWGIDDREFEPFTPDDTEFHTTDAFTDRALAYVDEYANETRPFLLYLAYTAPHYPLHAYEDDVAKYRGRYGAIGWDRLRDQRFARQIEMNVLPPRTRLSPRDPDLPAWRDLPTADREQWDLRMATYAAMIDHLDRSIGRLVEALERNGTRDRTIIFFLSDNGACEDSADRSTVPGSMPWEVTSYLTQGRPWANASNTPYRKYKTTNFEGGTRTPMIVNWPSVVPAGQWTDAVGHLIDFTPTMLDLASRPIPDDFPGRSLVPVFKRDAEAVRRTEPIYWQFNRAKAMREGDWKIVAYKSDDWELYNLRDDPSELNDLADQNRDRVKEMSRKWNAWWASRLNEPSVRETAR